MNLLLDTHIVLWALADDAALPASARAAITDGTNRAVVSAVSALEISIKRALGKLAAPDDFEDAIARSGFEAMSITMAHARRAGSLPPRHDDPFDRMLIAQAIEEGLTIVTVDAQFSEYGVGVLAS